MAEETNQNDPQIGNNEKVVMSESPSDVHQAHIGPILGVLVVILVLIFTGLYLWGSILPEEQQESIPTPVVPNNEPETPRANTDAQILGTVSSSDSLDAIQADLDSTNLDSLDSGLNQVSSEMDSSLTNTGQ